MGIVLAVKVEQEEALVVQEARGVMVAVWGVMAGLAVLQLQELVQTVEELAQLAVLWAAVVEVAPT